MRAIRVLLTHPFFWPHVTRGAEREVHGVGSRLAARGHRVALVTGRPTGLYSRADVDGIDVHYLRTPLPGALTRRGWGREGAFAVPAGLGAALSRADVVLSYYYADVVGAAAVRRRRPVVLKLTGAVPRDRVADNRVEHRLLARALDDAAEVWVNSRYAVEAMAGWDRPMRVLPAGVDVNTFRPGPPRAPVPLVVCTAAPADPRKRLVDLLDSWPAVVDAVPEARLMLVQRHDPETRARLLGRLPPALRPTVVLDGPYDDAGLAALYSRAWVTVAPAVHEALGLATLESLACGTPVAGADSGATPELLDGPALGRLYRPLEPAACAEAVIALLTAGEEPGDRERRRAAAARYAWPTIMDEVAGRLGRMVG